MHINASISPYTCMIYIVHTHIYIYVRVCALVCVVVFVCYIVLWCFAASCNILDSVMSCVLCLTIFYTRSFKSYIYIENYMYIIAIVYIYTLMYIYIYMCVLCLIHHTSVLLLQDLTRWLPRPKPNARTAPPRSISRDRCCESQQRYWW